MLAHQLGHQHHRPLLAVGPDLEHAVQAPLAHKRHFGLFETAAEKSERRGRIHPFRAAGDPVRAGKLRVGAEEEVLLALLVDGHREFIRRG